MYSVLCRRFSHLQRTLSLVNPVVPVAEPISSFFLNGSGLTRWVSTSPCLFAEPLKKKKRLDPAIIKAREDRRRRKLEKQIRRMEKTAQQLKPLQELEVPVSIVDTYYERLRQEIKISPEEEESRWLLQKDWARYMFRVNSAELRMIDRILASQQKALEELRKESKNYSITLLNL
ncbi:39S ribosomal protein L40, mitochondrial [Orchesella cincta]|uniref:Large ribosomal subunit protein mL40 n=1 Tax=Orchesella cincta TaxID=48709 RepID=A0A1D2NIV0_ORCCI|nr:39S ribosomal protein L40, mitochondrial [Orchesella cincta]